MEAFEGVVVGELQDLSHENNNRTKLERPSSPIIFTIASPHLSSGEVGGYNTNEENIALENNNDNDNNNNKEENITSENSNNINDEEENMKLKNSNNKVNSNDNDNNNNNQSNSSNIKLTPAKSFNGVNSTTAEDEDTARLLILLSQGNSRESSTINYYLDGNYSPPSTKFSSKKYIETSSNVDRKSGVFVYECKTCNRTFPSFQALGGHRASHKKPKNIAAEELKKRHFSSVFSDDYDYDFDPSSSSFSRNNNHSIMRKTATSRKTHECSYCGAEFTSGQALGGHMRRHRGSNGNNNSNYHYNPNNNNNNYNVNNTQPLLALSPSLMSSLSVNQDSLENKKQKTNKDNKDALSLSLSLSLDLNLPSTPSPENDQKNQESTDIEFIPEKISSPSPEKRHEQQQEQTASKESELLISTKPTLLDCQY